MPAGAKRSAVTYPLPRRTPARPRNAPWNSCRFRVSTVLNGRPSRPGAFRLEADPEAGSGRLGEPFEGSGRRHVPATFEPGADRQGGVSGRRWSGRVGLGGRPVINKQKKERV